MRMAVCEGNALQREMLREQLEAYSEKRKEKGSIAAFSDGERLLEYVACSGGFDVYFLENHLPGMSGMAVARTLRKAGDPGRIVFLTATTEFAVESLEVDVFHYLLKPARAEQLEKLLDRVREDNAAACYIIRNKRQTLPVRYGDIAYVDLKDRSPCFHLRDGSCVKGLILRSAFRNSLKALLEDSRFYPVGLSLLVNLDLAESLEGGVLRMCEGSRLMPPLSALEGLAEALHRQKI